MIHKKKALRNLPNPFNLFPKGENMKIVVALGGNAISREGGTGDIADQIRNCRKMAKYIVELADAGHNLVVTHGNGPQVGNILRRVEQIRDTVHPDPLDLCVAHTQAGIGYILQREINNAFHLRGTDKIAYTILTQCLVEPSDPQSRNPTKPIGPFFSKDQIVPMIEQGWKAIEDAGRGYRRVVPSPRPRKIIEERIIKNLINYTDIVICCGGGGIPVIEKEGKVYGVEGVIDKDHATSLLARRINADLMVLTTAVEKVALNFKKADEKFIDCMTIYEAKKYYKDGEFPNGSMGPKISAAIDFIEDTGNEVIITLPERIIDAINGKTGTRIIR